VSKRSATGSSSGKKRDRKVQEKMAAMVDKTERESMGSSTRRSNRLQKPAKGAPMAQVADCLTESDF